MSPKKQGLVGLLIAFVFALPLFVWSAINVNFNVRERAADDGSNYCGGTCGSNFNCQPNLYCHEGFCRNPECSSQSDCNCSNVSTATAIPTVKPIVNKTSIKVATKPLATQTSTSEPKGGTYVYQDSATLKPVVTSGPSLLRTTEDLKAPENQFFTKYAIYIFGAFILVVATSIVFAVKKKANDNIPHIMPPTNI